MLPGNPPAAGEGAGPESAPPKPRVLVVDDETTLLRVCELSLGAAGMDVTAAPTAERALELLGGTAFDVIVSDIMMPGMSGLDLLRTVRERNIDVPVLLMTATPELGSAQKAVEYGAFRYFIKPVDAQELQRAVEHAVRLGRRTRRHEIAPGLDAASPAPDALLPVEPVAVGTDPLVGRRLAGNFDIVERLGEGSAGRVYRARQVSLDKDVAVKVLHPQLTLHPMFVERFRREAYAASRLSHPNSVQVIEFGRDPTLGVFFLVMELLRGRDLQSVLRAGGPLSTERATRIMSQVLAALAEAHQTGVVHRDLKPENVVLIDRADEADVVKVCDFGIAQVVSPAGNAESRPDGKRITGSGLMNGTPQYMAPEQVRGEPCDARTDVYAAGVMLYEMLTGVCPFEGPDAITIVHKQVHEAPVPPSVRRNDVDPAFESVILRALAKNPAERQQSAGELRHELESVMEIARSEGKIALAYRRLIDLASSPASSIPPAPRIGEVVQKSAPAVAAAVAPAIPAANVRPPPRARGGIVLVVVALGASLLGAIVVATLASRHRKPATTATMHAPAPPPVPAPSTVATTAAEPIPPTPPAAVDGPVTPPAHPRGKIKVRGRPARPGASAKGANHFAEPPPSPY